MPRSIAAHVALGFLAIQALPLAGADIRNYRYGVWTHSGEEAYLDEIAEGAALPSNYFTVERDTQGRTVKESEVRNSKVISFRINHYVGDAGHYGSVDNYVAGEKTGTLKLTRDAQGYEIREDQYTNGGELTGYDTSEQFADHSDNRTFNAQGAEKRHFLAFFSTAGILNKVRVFASPVDYAETVYSESTGQEVSGAQFKNGAVGTRTDFVYDSVGVIVRKDFFDATGKKFITDSFVSGIASKRTYVFDDGTVGSEFRYVYDPKQMWIATEVYYRGSQICTLNYVRLADGTIQKTVANGLDGTVWAEYLDSMVSDIHRDGRPLSSLIRCQIFRAGNWWN